MPGLLSPQQVAELLRDHRAAQTKRLMAQPREATLAEQLTELRRELQDCVKAYARQTNSTPIAVNAEIKRVLGGLPAPMAGVEELQQRINLVRGWAIGR
jgi:hypothetical protein